MKINSGGPSDHFLWRDRRRIWGMPLSFTVYGLTKHRLFVRRGFLNTQEDEVLLYRVQDLRVHISLGQRIFGVGTVTVFSSDRTTPTLNLIDIKYPTRVREAIYKLSQEAKKERRVRMMEMNHVPGGMDPDGMWDD